MENSQGDKVPNKTEIGPPPPPGGAVRLRESMEVREVVGDPIVRSSEDTPEVFTSRPARRSTSELVKDLEAQLRGLSSDLKLGPEILTTDMQALTVGARSPVTDTEAFTEDVEGASDHTVCPSDREALLGDADDVKASFSQDFSEQPRPKSPVPELPPLEEPEPWLANLRGTGLLEMPTNPAHLDCQSPGDLGPSSGASAERGGEHSSPFEELMLAPSAFEYHELLPAAKWTRERSAAPRWQEEEEQRARSDCLTPLQAAHVELQVPDQQPGEPEAPASPSSSSPSPSSPLLPSAAESAPYHLVQVPLSPSLTQLFLAEGPGVELDDVVLEAPEPLGVALGPWTSCEEDGGVYVRVTEPCGQDYTRLGAQQDYTRQGGDGAPWGCSFLCCTRAADDQ
ncbi:hypothetical protein ACEWY4_027601 [Coilia grayii]|uniref:Uncharacterized protein n=1 Tax=Coilia grayii TaxID=363190 RepID=A0ABD1IP61_9TELE